MKIAAFLITLAVMPSANANCQDANHSESSEKVQAGTATSALNAKSGPKSQNPSITYKVEGMHCGGCAKHIQDEVCKIEGLDKCEVTKGQVVISSKTGFKIDQEQVQAAMKKAGDYKIISSKSSH